MRRSEPSGPVARMGRGTFLALVTTAMVGVLVVYGQTLGYGFRFDDYHTVRPWTNRELWQVLHGSWDPLDIESDFYRPLTAWWYALRFELFGWNAPAQHAISLAGMIACSWLTGLFVWRETGGRRAAVLAAGLYAIHPALVYAQGVWLTNQMHLFASLAVLAAMLSWQRARARSLVAWWPVFALQVVAFGFKEDTLMLMPLLVALTALRARLVGDVKGPSWTVIAVGFGLMVALAGLRYAMLGGLGVYGRMPSVERGSINLGRGIFRVLLLLPATRPWEWLASAFSVGVLLVGGLLRQTRDARVCLALSGLLVAVSFDFPFLFVTKPEQYHLLALGAVLALTGYVEAIIQVVPGRIPRLSLASAMLAGALAFVPLSRDLARDFAPCSARTLATDALSMWRVVPEEVKAWLRAKPEACRQDRLVPLPAALVTATWPARD